MPQDRLTQPVKPIGHPVVTTVEQACEYMPGLTEKDALLTHWQHAARLGLVARSGLLALLRNDAELHSTILDVENRVCGFSLREDNVAFAISGDRLALADIGEKSLEIG